MPGPGHVIKINHKSKSNCPKTNNGIYWTLDESEGITIKMFVECL